MKKDYPNIKVKEFPLPVLKAMKKANDELMVELEKRGPLTKEIIESQRAYLKKARDWTKISEYLYLKSMYDIEK
jgi:TRAP-type mannitol/chloroaromatic compound transport system substrate-binding protein